MKKSLQQPLPPMELQNVSQPTTARKIVTQPDPVAIASQLFDEAVTLSGLSANSIAITLQVSESLVSRWRSTRQRELPSYGQLVALPVEFQAALQQVHNRRFQFGQAALRRLLTAIGDVAFCMGDEERLSA